MRENHWNLWVYPTAPDEPEPAGVLVTRALDDAALQTLKTGGKVLLLAHGLKNAHTAKTGFESVYWSAGWWGNRFSSLGVLCDPKHPALAAFPNDGVSDWQWRELCAGATTFDLDRCTRRIPAHCAAGAGLPLQRAAGAGFRGQGRQRFVAGLRLRPDHQSRYASSGAAIPP